MSRFHCSAQGDDRKGVSTRAAQRILETHCRGWDAGVLVVARKAAKAEGLPDALDVFDVYVTGGSNRPKMAEPVLTLICEKSTGHRRIELMPIISPDYKMGDGTPPAVVLPSPKAEEVKP